MSQEPDARVVDDKVAAAHEPADRIEKSAGQASVQSDTEPSAPNVGDLGAVPSADVDHMAEATQKINTASEKLKQQSTDLKRRIEEAQKSNSMPLDSQLGKPSFERRAADGSLDVEDDDDD
jgi:hypothetical protein